MTDPTSTNRQNTLRTLAMLCGLSALAIIIRALFAPWQPTFPDSFTYLKLSECLLNGKLFVEHWVGGPYTLSMTKSLYAVLITGIGFIFNDRETAATIISVMSGGLLLIPVFYIGKTLYGEITAWISVVLVLFNPYMIQFSGWILTESLFTFLFITSISLTVVMLNKGWPSYLWILSGLLSGLVYLSREVGILVFPMVIFWVVFYKLIIQKIGFMKTAQLPVFLIIGFLIIYFPGKIAFRHINMVIQESIGTKGGTAGNDSVRISLGVRLGATVENLIYTPDLQNPQEYEQVTSRLTPDGTDFQPVRKGPSGAHIIKVLWEGKWVLWEMLWKGIGRYAAVFWSSFSVIVIIFLIIGFFSHIVKGPLKLFLTSWVIGYVALLILAGTANFAFGGFELQRYMMPVFPILFLWTGYGVEILADWLVRGAEKSGLVVGWRRVKQAGAVILSLLVLATFLPHVRNLNRYNGNQKSFPMMVGQEIKKRSPYSPLVMARTSAIPYYSGGDFLLTPYESYDRLIEFAKKKRVDFIVITNRDRRPLLGNLLSIEAPKPGLKYEFGLPDRMNPDRLMLAVYRVLGEE